MRPALLLILGILFIWPSVLRAETEIYFFQRGYVPGGTGAATTLTDAAIAAFEVDHPDIRVLPVGVPWGSEGDLKLRTALLAGRKIDLFRLAHDQLPAFVPRRGKLLSPLGDRLTDADRADFGEQALAAMSVDGEVLAWPLWSTALVMVANSHALESAGIEADTETVWNWNEFAQVLETVTASGQWHGLNAASRPPLFEWAPLLMAHAGPLFDPCGEPASEDQPVPMCEPKLAEGLERIKAWREAGLLAPGFGIDNSDKVKQDFLQGRLAFMITSPGFIKELAAGSMPFLMLAPPASPTGEPITTGGLGCFAVVDSGDPARAEAAHALGRYLTSTQIATAVPGWYLAPPVRRSVTTFYDDPAYAPLARILSFAHYHAPDLPPGMMDGVIIPNLQAAVLGEKSPQKALDTIQRTARRRMVH